MVLVINPGLDRFSSTLRKFVLLELEAIPASLPEVQELFRGVHEEIAVIAFTPCRIAVIPLAVEVNIIPEMRGGLIRISFDDHVIDSCYIEQSLYRICSRIAVAGTRLESVVSGLGPRTGIGP